LRRYKVPVREFFATRKLYLTGCLLSDVAENAVSFSNFRHVSNVRVIPKPLCSLTETDFGMARRQRMPYEDSLISELARTFDQPDPRVSVDPCSRTLTEAEVTCDAVCGCARHVPNAWLGRPPPTLNSKWDCSTTIV